MSTDWLRSFPDAPVPPPGTNPWNIREEACSRNRWRARCIVDNTHPDATVLDGPIETNGAFELWRVGVDAAGHSVISLNPLTFPGAPPLWFVVIPELAAPEPAMTLVGFATDDVPFGTVLTDPEFFSLPVSTSMQVGAIRWWHLDGVVDQVFIAEEWRRRHLGTLMTYAANAFQVHNGWPAKLTSDGRRTELGRHLDAGTQFPDRFSPIEETSPPMDPPKGT